GAHHFGSYPRASRQGGCTAATGCVARTRDHHFNRTVVGFLLRDFIHRRTLRTCGGGDPGFVCLRLGGGEGGPGGPGPEPLLELSTTACPTWSHSGWRPQFSRLPGRCIRSAAWGWPYPDCSWCARRCVWPASTCKPLRLTSAVSLGCQFRAPPRWSPE